MLNRARATRTATGAEEIYSPQWVYMGSNWWMVWRAQVASRAEHAVACDARGVSNTQGQRGDQAVHVSFSCAWINPSIAETCEGRGRKERGAWLQVPA
eukprot:6459808-Amphidinium_carterae.1